MYRRLLALLLAVAPIAPAFAAPDPGALAEGLRALQEIDARVALIGHRLARANLPLCTLQEPLPGFAVHALGQYAPGARAAATAEFGLGAAPTVSLVVPGSAAERAGLVPGDRLLSINGAPVAPAPLGERADYAAIEAVENRLEAALAAGPARLAVERAGRALSLRLPPDPGCVSRVQVIPSRRLNASADGEYAQLTTRIVALARTDAELAMIVAHEMAHNILEHRVRLEAQGVRPGLGRRFGSGARQVKVTEIEADYLAHYLAARAGYAVAEAPAFYRRLSRASGDFLFGSTTHLAGGRRVRYSEAVAAEIAAKRARGEPLLPSAAAPTPGR